ncbi:hypothetical protein KIPB_012932, partial [Kipferlia bialata]
LPEFMRSVVAGIKAEDRSKKDSLRDRKKARDLAKESASAAPTPVQTTAPGGEGEREREREGVVESSGVRGIAGDTSMNGVQAEGEGVITAPPISL